LEGGKSIKKRIHVSGGKNGRGDEGRPSLLLIDFPLLCFSNHFKKKHASNILKKLKREKRKPPPPFAHVPIRPLLGDEGEGVTFHLFLASHFFANFLVTDQISKTSQSLWATLNNYSLF